MKALRYIALGCLLNLLAAAGDGVVKPTDGPTLHVRTSPTEVVLKQDGVQLFKVERGQDKLRLYQGTEWLGIATLHGDHARLFNAQGKQLLEIRWSLDKNELRWDPKKILSVRREADSWRVDWNGTVAGRVRQEAAGQNFRLLNSAEAQFATASGESKPLALGMLLPAEVPWNDRLLAFAITLALEK